jgi:hypothetical protein
MDVISDCVPTARHTNHNTTGYQDLIPMGSAFNNCPGRDNISVGKKTINVFGVPEGPQCNYATVSSYQDLIPMGSAFNNCPGRDNISVGKND